jgi:hypothetical protein
MGSVETAATLVLESLAGREKSARNFEILWPGRAFTACVSESMQIAASKKPR